MFCLASPFRVVQPEGHRCLTAPCKRRPVCQQRMRHLGGKVLDHNLSIFTLLAPSQSKLGPASLYVRQCSLAYILIPRSVRLTKTYNVDE
ncbi:hypothetical protein K523DRAFT_323258 [Schizophyllum commune Tattone D]|nr:hypothetical protein K523DRAFT_323258 [Schizophyllum commune Tattone D]